MYNKNYTRKNMYKLVAIDLDGTLLNSYGEVSEKNKNRHMKPNKIILKDSTKKIQVFVTSYHSTQRIRQEIIIKENQPVNFFGIDFVLRKGILYAKRNKEEKTFFSPGSYYIDISPIDGTWLSGKVHTPFEGKHHPKQ